VSSRVNRTVPKTEVETVVIGAGHAGLAASLALTQRGAGHVVLEEGRIGQTWRNDRWDSFRLNTPRWMSRLPGQTLADGERDGFDTAPEFVRALEEGARLHGLPVKEETGPARVSRANGGFEVRTAGGAIAAENVILATGFQRLPTRPPLAESLPARTLQLDTTTYRSPEALPAGAVLVVGGGQSGAQIAEDVARAGRRVLLSTSKVGWVPRRYRGRDSLGWWTVSGFYEVRRADVDPAVLRTRQPLVSGNDDGHSLTLPSLARLGVELLGRLEGGAGEELRFGGGVAEHVRFGDELAAQLLKRVDDFIAQAGIDAEPATPDPAAEPVPGLGEDTRRSLRLDRDGIGTVIWCTGMRPRLDAVAIPGLVEDGALPHTDGAAPVAGLYLIGAPWLRVRKSGIIWGAGDDAEQIADSITVGLRAAS
jgi:putative flavoprotein involved in K+ transport